MSTKQILATTRLSALVAMISLSSFAADNLVRNGGFEEELSSDWQKRTPDDAKHRSYRVKEAPHNGEWCVVLECASNTTTMLRQGHAGALTAAVGAMVEIAGWVRMDAGSSIKVSIRLVCFDEQYSKSSKPLADVASRPATGPEWTRLRALVMIPDGTYCIMPYLQITGGTGKAYFDDIELHVIAPPPKRMPPRTLGVLSDLPEGDPCLQNLKLLAGKGYISLNATNLEADLGRCDGATVLYKNELPVAAWDVLRGYAGRGHSVFMELHNFAAMTKLNTAIVDDKTHKNIIANETIATTGFSKGQPFPRISKKGELLVLAGLTTTRDGIEPLAMAGEEGASLVRMPIGKGYLYAADMLSIEEPIVKDAGSFNKYLPLVNTLLNPVRYGEYYLKKPSYTELVSMMKDAVAQYPALIFKEEGPASDGSAIYSLNIGRSGTPLYLCYAAFHGSEWDPGLGLLTFAKRLARGEFKDIIDMEKMSFKFIPMANPSGFEKFRRQNANGVDLNRQSDCAWEKFAGTDSNKDGKYGPGDYDWKGAAPFSEPEAMTYKKICDSASNLFFVLDFHGNTSAFDNRLCIYAATGRSDNQDKAMVWTSVVNERVRGRHLLQQAGEDSCSLYLMKNPYCDSIRPTLINYSVKDRYGFIVELTAGYSDTRASVLVTDMVCEILRGIAEVYPPSLAGGK